MSKKEREERRRKARIDKEIIMLDQLVRQQEMIEELKQEIHLLREALGKEEDDE
jgi:hypothetical protein